MATRVAFRVGESRRAEHGCKGTRAEAPMQRDAPPAAVRSCARQWVVASIAFRPRGRNRREEPDDEQQYADAEECDDAWQPGQRAEIDDEELDHHPREERGAEHPERPDL